MLTDLVGGAADVLQLELLGTTLLQWSRAMLAGLGTFAALVLVRRVLIRRLGAIAARTATSIDDIVVELARRTRRVVLFVLALWPAAWIADLSQRPAHALRLLTVLTMTVQGAIWVSVAVTRGVQARLRGADPASATTLGALGVMIRTTLYLVLLLLALSNLGVNVNALLTGLGIGGVAVALALQSILGDLFASLSIVLDKPFVLGDFVVVEELMGTVEHIGLKTTRIRSLSGEQIVFANGDLLKSRIRNFKRMAERRVAFTVGLVYQTPAARLSAVPEMLRSIIVAEAGVRFDRAHFRSFDDSALTFEVVYYVLDTDYNLYMDIQQRILLAIARRFEQEGIECAYPTRTVFVKSDSTELAR